MEGLLLTGPTPSSFCSTTLAEYAVHLSRRCLALGWAWTCLFSSGQVDYQSVSDTPTGWPNDHGKKEQLSKNYGCFKILTPHYLKTPV